MPALFAGLQETNGDQHHSLTAIFLSVVGILNRPGFRLNCNYDQQRKAGDKEAGKVGWYCR